MITQIFSTMKKIILYGLAAVLLLAWQSTAQAHAFLDHAEPPVGDTISTPPTVVKVWFTQELEPAFSTLEVCDAQGKPVDKKDAHLDDKDKTLLIVSLSPLPPGSYTVTWHAVSVDTHKTQGHFEFTVK
jgi:copper resistance protein C